MEDSERQQHLSTIAQQSSKDRVHYRRILELALNLYAGEQGILLAMLKNDRISDHLDR